MTKRSIARRAVGFGIMLVIVSLIGTVASGRVLAWSLAVGTLGLIIMGA